MLKDKKKLIESILKEERTNFIIMIFLYYCFSTVLKLIRSICTKSIHELIISTIIVIAISIIDYVLYAYIINRSNEILLKNKSKLTSFKSFIFAFFVLLIEYIFQMFLLMISNNFMLMMSVTLVLSILRIMYVPFLHFILYNIKDNKNIFRSIINSIQLVASNVMEILYFSLGFYFINLVHNYMIYYLASTFDIHNTINVYELIMYNENKIVFILLEIVFNVLMAIVSSKMFVYFAWLFKESTSIKKTTKKHKKSF